MPQSEDAIQSDFFQSVWNKFPQTRHLLFAVPNGGRRTVTEAAKFKATGVVAGIPDMCFCWDGKIYGIEVKTETGVLSPNQKKVHAAWEAQNIEVFVIRSAKEGLKIIESIIK